MSLRLNPDAILTETEGPDGPMAVLLHLGTRRYYTLNETGLSIWQGLEAGEESAALVTRLCTHFEVNPADATAHVERLLLSLRQAGLVEG